MNVICICLDTFRPDIIGPGKALSHCQTPNLDQLCSESAAFEGAYGEGQPTLQIRRAFFTGHRSFPWRYNFDHRGHWHHAPGWHWRYSVMTHLPDGAEELYDLHADPAEERDVAPLHADVVALQRARIEEVIKQPLPATYNEVCDPAPAPIAQYLRRKRPL